MDLVGLGRLATLLRYRESFFRKRGMFMDADGWVAVAEASIARAFQADFGRFHSQQAWFSMVFHGFQGF